MREDKIEWKQLVRYLSGEASPEECWSVEWWIASDPEHEDFFNQLEAIWNDPVEEKQPWDSQEGWLRYRATYGSEENDLTSIFEQELSTPKNEPAVSRSHSWKYQLGLVATIAAVFLIAIFVFPHEDKIVSTPRMKTFAARYGQQASLHFSDGSSVQLNSGSRLRVPETFADSVREVWLKGEGYFEIKHDPERPFLVHTDHTVTRVLGTRFGVRAYREEARVQVVVAEGVVTLRDSHVSSDEAQYIRRNQKGTVSRKGRTVVSDVTDIHLYLGWTKGRLVFKNEPLKEVVNQLERWYDIKVKLEGTGLARRRLTAAFTAHQPLDRVLDAIALTLDVNYSRHDSTILFNKKINTNGE